MNLKKNLKGMAGACLAVMLLVSSFSITVSAQGNGPAPPEPDTRALRELTGDIDGITPWILNYCDEEAPAFSAYQAAHQTALDIWEGRLEANQQQIDEAAKNLRDAYLTLEATLDGDKQMKSLRTNLQWACSNMDQIIFHGIPLPNDITAASYDRMKDVRLYIERITRENPEPEQLIGAVRRLQEAIASIEINNADYTELQAAFMYQREVVDPVSWQYTKNSYERYVDTCDYCYREFECIPTQERTDEMVALIEDAKQALILKGDNNDDGHISIKDVTNIQKDLARIQTLEGDAYEAADVNSDGELNMQDVILSQKFIAKTIDRFPDNSAA